MSARNFNGFTDDDIRKINTKNVNKDKGRSRESGTTIRTFKLA